MSRPIDADALDGTLRDRQYGLTEHRGGYRYLSEEDKVSHDALQRMIELVANAPTIDAAPVVHGKWMIKPFLMQNDPPNTKPWNVRYHCSECDFVTGPTSADYCPSCGAKMDMNKEVTP